MPPFLANTDIGWFDFLAERAGRAPLDEVNFWSPKTTEPLKHFEPAELVFLRLKSPVCAIAGFGFFASHGVLSLQECWSTFGWKNGAADRLSFFRQIGGYRYPGRPDVELAVAREPLGCTMLRMTHFWPRSRWIPWRQEKGFAKNIVRGRTEHDPERMAELLHAMSADQCARPADFEDQFVPLAADQRKIVEAMSVQREGQGSFRARLLDVYSGRCAITGEHTKPVLDAAHIQPYLGPRSNHIQNGIVLTKEFHTLFDLGYVTVTPDYEVRVAPRLRKEWDNGHRYYAYDERRLVQVPSAAAARPSREALEWHQRHVFLG